MDRQKEIRSQLKNGVSINQICKDYGLSFNELLELMKYNNPRRKSNRPRSLMYIMERDGHFYLRKAGKHYGTYFTVDDALKVRDYYMTKGWCKEKLDSVCRIVGVERVKPKKGRL